MDLNIGAALWLAASGQGTLHLPAGTSQAQAQVQATTSTNSGSGDGSGSAVAGPSGLGEFTEGSAYRSPARVVLLGHGADEQCAGYGRHRTK